MKSILEVMPLWTEFFEDLQLVRGRSLNTIQAYRRDLELWVAYRQKSSSVAGFYDFMKSKHDLSVRSQARVISSLRTYFKFLERNNIKAPELRELRPPKVKVGLPKPLTFQEFEQLFKACEVESPDKTFRNQVTLLMLFGLGCRVSELISASLCDISEVDRSLRIIGKGNKERIVPISDSVWGSLEKYISEVRSNLKKVGHALEDSLILNDRGNRPSRVDIWRWLAAWSEKAGMSEPIGPHRFRHGCATALLESGADLRSIQALLGHSSIQTTQVYTSVTVTHLTETIDQHHPLSGLKGKDI